VLNTSGSSKRQDNFGQMKLMLDNDRQKIQTIQSSGRHAPEISPKSS